MLKDFADIAPKAAVMAAVVWAGANYAFIGPQIAARVTRADVLPACEANSRGMIAKAGEERARSLPIPSIDPAQEYAASQIRRLQNNPFMDELRRMSGGMGDMFGIEQGTELALRQMENGKRAAKEAYESALARIREQTATELSKAGNICGCLADAAIAETRTEWAIFSGTLGLIRPAPLEAFGERMAQVHATGRCSAVKAAS